MLRTILTLTRSLKTIHKPLFQSAPKSFMRAPIRFRFSSDKNQPKDKPQQKEKQMVEKKEQQIEKKEEPENQTQQKQPENPGMTKKAWNFIVDSWKHTFPDEEYEVKRLREQRKKSIKETSIRIKEEKQQAAVAAAAAAAAAEQANSLVALKDQKAEQEEQRKKQVKKQQGRSKLNTAGKTRNVNTQKAGLSGLAKSVSQSIYDNAKAGDTAIAKGFKTISGMIEDKQSIGNAAQQMRRIDQQFQTTDLETQAKFLFVQTMNDFMKGKFDTIQKVCSDQAYQFFKSYKEIYKARNIRPYATQFMNPHGLALRDAIIAQKTTPVFVFFIKGQQIYCFLDNKDGKIVEGDPSRLQSVTYQFAIRYEPALLQSEGHPWELIQIKKLQDTPMLV